MNTLPGILLIALLTVSAQAQTPAPLAKSTPSPTPAPLTVKPGPFTYKMPLKAIAGTRRDVDAGTRGWSAKLPSVYALAPDHTGLTTSGQPSLFWYQSGPANTPIEVTIIEPHKPGKILRVGADTAEQGGIHRLPLERYRVTLSPGVVYKWTVSLILDPANRSQDLIASDTIERIAPDAQLAAALTTAKGLDKAAIYAGKGIWYDALEAVTNEIDASPKNKEHRLLRAALLDQAGLKAAAASERK
ncbi:MAG: DUF928 domain-containing protein [Chthoniobacter sp.]